MADHDEIPDSERLTPLAFRIPPSETGRVLPSREVNRDTIQPAFVQFILFCNPEFNDEEADTERLGEVFSSPPTSSKKSFHVYDVYLQVKRLLGGEIKLWSQVALDLGVEPGPDEERSGASQRVVQYIVRLKRWMKLTHTDAFFDYLMGRPHEYYLHIPPLSDARPATGRDGVSAADDLALRALDPSLRPKRGRKRLLYNSEDLPPEQRHSLSNVSVAKRPNLSGVPSSAFPQSAATDASPWSSVSRAFYAQRDLPTLEPQTSLPPSMTVPAGGPTNKTLCFISSPYTANAQQYSAHVTGAQLETSPGGTTLRQKLQVQVPDHQGGPVMLMTPDVNLTRYSVENGDAMQWTPAQIKEEYNRLRSSIADRLLNKTEVQDRINRLSPIEAKDLATGMLDELIPGPTAAYRMSDVHTAAVRLGQPDGVTCGPLAASIRLMPNLLVSKIEVRRVAASDDGEDDGANVSGQLVERFDISWNMICNFVSIRMRFTGLELSIDNITPVSAKGPELPVGTESTARANAAGQELEASDGAVDWQAQCLELRKQNQLLRESLANAKSQLIGFANAL